MPENGVAANRKTVSVINLGCAKNEVDSEEMLGQLENRGHQISYSHAPADVPRNTDVLVINTCAFIESAREQSVNTILEALERKKRGEVGRVVVAGCLAQRYPQELAAELPELDGLLGTGQIDQIGPLVEQSLIRTGQITQVNAKPHHTWVDTPTRVRIGAPWTAYLKISEGCDHACTFCSIPSFRGRHVSKPLERILQEAHSLAEQGVQEINLIAQDSTQYGYDLYGEACLPQLLRELSALEKLHWIRLFYCYPSRVNDAIIEAIAHTPRVCHYIDMPLQHADDAILRKMRRPLSGKAYLDLVRRFREAAPDVALRTTFITGFPGETEEHFQNLLAFVEEAQFDRVGVFPYSTEENTPSAALEPKVPARVKNTRRNRLMELQQKISYQRNQNWVGRELEILVEGRSASDPTTAVGRSFRDGPEVDGQVYIARCMALPGTFVKARITQAQAYDLIAEPVAQAWRTPQTSSAL